MYKEKFKKLRVFRYAVRRGNRKSDKTSEVEWEVRITKDGIYFGTETNVYFLDFRDTKDEEETITFLKKVLA